MKDMAYNTATNLTEKATNLSEMAYDGATNLKQRVKPATEFLNQGVSNLKDKTAENAEKVSQTATSGISQFKIMAQVWILYLLQAAIIVGLKLGVLTPLPDAKQQLNTVLGPGAAVLNPVTNTAQRLTTPLNPVLNPVTDATQRVGTTVGAGVVGLLSLVNLNLFALLKYVAIAVAAIVVLIIIF